MDNGNRHHTLAPWVVVLGVIAGLSLLIAVAATIDGRIAAWSQHLAQNAADAAARAGAKSLQELLDHPNFECGVTPDRLVLEQVQLYADLNQIPETAWGLNVQAYYLGQDANSERFRLETLDAVQHWQVGATNVVPCEAISGLHVEVYYPQETLLTQLLAIKHARVTVAATSFLTALPQ